MVKFKYKIERYNDNFFVLQILKQHESITNKPSDVNYKILYTAKNGWEIRSHRFCEVRKELKVIYILGNSEYSTVIDSRMFHTSNLTEVSKALIEFSDYINKNPFRIPESYYEI